MKQGRTELFYAILVACDILRRGIERAEVLNEAEITINIELTKAIKAIRQNPLRKGICEDRRPNIYI